MKVKFINSRLQYVVFANLINHSECTGNMFIRTDGTIGKGESKYYISNKIPFIDSISCNRFYTSGDEAAQKTIATAVVKRNSDDSVVRVIQFTINSQWVGVAPNIVWNEETDTDTYIILCATFNNTLGKNLEDWKATYGSFVFKKYIQTI